MHTIIPSIHELLALGIKDKENRNILLKRLNYKYKAFCKNSKSKSIVDKLDLEIRFQKYIFDNYGIKFDIFSENELTDIYAKKAIAYPAHQSIMNIFATYLQSDIRRWLFAYTMLNDSKSHRV